MQHIKRVKPKQREPIRLSKPIFSEKAVYEIENVLKTGMLREGPITARFEDCFRKTVGAEYAYSVSSGSTALQLALMSCLEPGSRVLVPAFTFIATASSVIHAGCVPVFVDVDPDTFLMDIDDAWEKVDEDTGAVIPVHLFGNVVEYEKLLEISEEYRLRIIHDCAQALGSTYKGIELGALNDLCCYSFYPSKIITTGEGGMVTTNKEEYDYKGRLLKNHGESKRYNHDILGYNYRSNEIASILGLDQLTGLQEALEKRAKIAKYYDLAIEKMKGMKPQQITKGTVSCYNYYTLQVSADSGLDRNQITMGLKKRNIEAAVYYPRALTEQPALKKYTRGSCPEAEDLAKRVFSIPIHPSLRAQDIETVVQGLKEII